MPTATGIREHEKIDFPPGLFVARENFSVDSKNV